MDYTTPTITELGSLLDLTLQSGGSFQKVGSRNDALSSVLGQGQSFRRF